MKNNIFALHLSRQTMSNFDQLGLVYQHILLTLLPTLRKQEKPVAFKNGLYPLDLMLSGPVRSHVR